MPTLEYQRAFRQLPTLAAVIDGAGRFVDLSDALLARLGYRRDDLLGQTPETFMTESSARRVIDEFRPALRRTGRLEQKPVSFLTRAGETIDCMTNAVADRDADGAFVYTLASYREIAEDARSNFKYRDLYRLTPAMLHTVDAEGRVVTVTDRWLQKLKYQRSDVIGRPILDFYAGEDREKWGGGRLRDLITSGDFNNLERRMLTSDGKVLDMLVSAIAHRDEQGRVDRLLVASKDVTERIAAEKALRLSVAENARLKDELQRERDFLREEFDVAMNFGRIVGSSRALNQVLQRVEAVAQTSASVLLLGESGVGKELVARALHSSSPRADNALIKVNCASIPKELFESEFFGHVRGAFTGAHRDRVGRFQLADGGTIFLDEVGEIPLELQGKLLRVLQESEFERVGDDRTMKVDVRVVAATNRDLEGLVAAGEFREDLYYRLSVFPIEVPPLRDRGDDVIQLAQEFLAKASADFGRDKLALTRAQADRLRAYHWPGNVRELKNVIERAVILSPGNELRLDASLPTHRDIDERPVSEATSEAIMTDAELRRLEKDNTRRALERANWKVSGKGGAAEMLGVRPTTLADRIRSWQILKP